LSRVSIETRGHETLEHPTARLELLLDAHIDQIVSYEVGTLTVEIPSRVVLPERGKALATLRHGHDDERAQVLTHEIAADARSSVLRFEDVLVGEFELAFEIVDANAELAKIPNADGGFTFRRKPIFESTTPVTIQPNATTEVRIP
jgi:hypothetical protein